MRQKRRPQLEENVAPHGVRVAKLAARQHGVVSRRQLLAIGLSKDEIWHRVGAGSLHRIHAGVYAVGHRLRLPYTRHMAAVLACSPGAFASHRAAGEILGLVPGRRPTSM